MNKQKLKEIADILNKVADGAELQYYADDEWFTAPTNNILLYIHQFKIRLKPQIININGYDVPEPVRTPLNNGDEYWYVDTTMGDPEEMADTHIWRNDKTDNTLLTLGLIHLTKENATLHANAIFSFTKLKES